VRAINLLAHVFKPPICTINTIGVKLDKFMTDDWGNVSSEVKCECGHAWTYEREKEEMGDPYEPDTLEELWGEA